jgi:glyoxylase-like metal-dependent hydrolase (beta-lactamase superfamily II)
MAQMTRRGAMAGLIAAPLSIGSANARADQPGGTVVHRVDQKQPFPVNAYIVEGADGLVIVDALLTVSASRELRRQADAIGKPIKAVLLTHPHPDHYAGLATVTAGLNVPIVAQAGVDEVVRRDDDQKDMIVGPMFGAEWPKSRVFPNEQVGDGTRLAFGPGLLFRAVDIGPAESHHDSMFILEGDRPAAFIGDLTYDLMHSYMADGEADGWRRAIARFQAELPEDMLLYVGHGAPTTAALLQWQRAYLDKFESAVRAADWQDRTKATETVIGAMKGFLPTDDLVFLMTLSIEPTAKRLGLL